MDLLSGVNFFTIAVLFLGLIIVLSAVKVVPQGWEYTVERFGRFTGVLRPGSEPHRADRRPCRRRSSR